MLTLALGPFVYVFALHEKYYKTCYFFCRLWCLGLFYGMGFRYELINLSGKKVDKNGKYVMIANHTSMMDVFLPVILHPEHPISMVGKKELERIPFFGSIYRKVCVTVDRKDPKSRSQVYVKCAERIENGYNIVLFPEGGVTDDLSIILQDFKDGAFKLSNQYKFPIIVYTFIDLKFMFPFNNAKGYPGKVKIFLNDILDPHDSIDSLKDKTHSLMLNTIKEHSKEFKNG